MIGSVFERGSEVGILALAGMVWFAIIAIPALIQLTAGVLNNNNHAAISGAISIAACVFFLAAIYGGLILTV